MSSRQPKAESRVISLFDWSEFFDSGIISILTKADEILSCNIDALKERNYSAIKKLGEHFSYYASRLRTTFCL